MPEWDEAKGGVKHPPVALSLLAEIEIDEHVRLRGCPRHGHPMVKIKPGVYRCTKCKCRDCGSPVYWDFWPEN